MRYLVSIILWLSMAPALAAQDETAERAAQQAREAAEARVDADMVTMRNLAEALSKNLGQLHYLRTLCFGNTDQTWRTHAGNMMALEAQGDASRRRELVRAFNAGYYQQKERFSACTGDASVDAAALAENGRHLASMLGDPFRDPS